jgi:hypothetical protein
VVVEHKGLSDGLVFFHAQRVCGQQVPSWDKPAPASDDCPTPESLRKNRVQNGDSGPLYVDAGTGLSVGDFRQVPQ